jgi:hypothetical protein
VHDGSLDHRIDIIDEHERHLAQRVPVLPRIGRGRSTQCQAGEASGILSGWLGRRERSRPVRYRHV